MYELWQTEWCPASRRVRQRLTELGIDYVIRQVPVERDERALLRRRTGRDTIPVLVTRAGVVLAGEQEILVHLDANEPVPALAQAHRAKAERARRRYLDEECGQPPPSRGAASAAPARREIAAQASASARTSRR
jgi:glutathione S-transferase